MPPIVNFSIDAVKAVFSEHGIHVLEEFPDGQIMWGNEPITNPYPGHFQMSHPYPFGRMEIFTIRGILNKLDKAGLQPDIENKLYASLQEDEYETDGEHAED
jgi:hypothetical protein